MASASHNILAVTYSDGFAADRLIADTAYRLRDDGVTAGTWDREIAGNKARQ